MGKRLHKKSTLWRGAILGGIVNAVMTAESHGYAHTRQWIKNHYILNGGDGRDGVITFAGGHWLEPAPLIGVFLDCHSDRSPYHWAEYDLERFFRNCSDYQRSFADQGALSFLQQVVHGKQI